jgi:hypothetical protein
MGEDSGSDIGLDGIEHFVAICSCCDRKEESRLRSRPRILNNAVERQSYAKKEPIGACR